MTVRIPNPRQGANPAFGLGMQLAVGMAVFTAGGIWLDRKRGGGVLFTLVGVGLGLFYCGYEIWKIVQRLKEEGGEAGKKDNIADAPNN